MTNENENTTPPADPPSPPPPPPPPPTAPQYTQRLVRHSEDKVIAGVASGLAFYTRTDPVLWRIGFVVGAFLTGGLVAIAYLVLWLVTPESRPGQGGPPREHTMDGGRWVGIIAIAIGGLLALRAVFDFLDFAAGGVFWGLVLIVVGVVIWGRDWTSRDIPRPPRPPRPERPARTAFASPSVEPATEPLPTTTSQPRDPSPGVTPQVAKPRREPSLLGRYVIGAAALVVGLGLVLHNAGVYEVTAKGMIALILGVIGFGLLVGAWRGRARWLIIPGSVLAIALITITAIPFNLRGGWGELVWSPESRAEVASSYEHGAGQAALDLSEIDFGKRDRKIDVRLGFGELYIVLPDEPHVVVDAHVQGGEMTLFGRVSEGWDVTQHARSRGERGAATVHINTKTTFGELHVLRGTTDDIPGGTTGRFNGGRVEFRFRDNNND